MTICTLTRLYKVVLFSPVSLIVQKVLKPMAFVHLSVRSKFDLNDLIP